MFGLKRDKKDDESGQSSRVRQSLEVKVTVFILSASSNPFQRLDKTAVLQDVRTLLLQCS